MRAYFRKRAEKRPESAHFMPKTAIFISCDRSTVLTDLRREMRAGAIAASPTESAALGPRRENVGNSGLSRHARANAFRKSECVLSSQSEAACKSAPAAKALI
jgi:hypothetical protein